ncbi:hypothetical protein DERP_001160 [Dermatophagoides pteronyssinus]|uniref:Uncharacterized protein n=1 Tax=Dermatophagoides pteronyssinus TaxID=6956 RepID=A0ABQ8JDP8_DERPT|nr:hypothetical protein DERP_001160 [Dermatophagoides pteronyssinus]
MFTVSVFLSYPSIVQQVSLVSIRNLIINQKKIFPSLNRYHHRQQQQQQHSYENVQVMDEMIGQ